MNSLPVEPGSGAFDPVVFPAALDANMTGNSNLPDNGFGQLNAEGSFYNFNNNDSIFWSHYCECHNRAFRKRADLARHYNKQLQRFRCEEQDCPSASNGQPACFGTLNDKKRHYRDVHRMTLDGEALERFLCPWEGCRRHTEGFPRRQNLESHIKSLHGGNEPEVADEENDAPFSAPLPAVPPLTAAPSDIFADAGPSTQPIFSAPSPHRPDLAADPPSPAPPVPPLTTATSMESMLTLSTEEACDSLLRAMTDEYSKSQQDYAALNERLHRMQTEMQYMLDDSKQWENYEADLRRRIEERRHVVRKRRAASKKAKSMTAGVRKSA